MWPTPWILAIVFMAGTAFGGGGSWWIQGLRLESVQSKFDGFVSAVKAQGEAAQKLADAKSAEDKRLKENADHEYQATISSLRANVKRLRDKRSSTNYVPAAAANSRVPKIACFNRPELEQAIQRLDDGISGLIEEGDSNTIRLRNAKRWVSSDKIPSQD